MVGAKGSVRVHEESISRIRQAAAAGRLTMAWHGMAWDSRHGRRVRVASCRHDEHARTMAWTAGRE